MPVKHILIDFRKIQALNAPKENMKQCLPYNNEINQSFHPVF